MGISSAGRGLSDRMSMFLVAVVLAVSGALISPELLASIGVMTGSLQHELELVRQTTLLEITVLRIAAAFGAVVCAVLALLWPRIEASDRYRRFVSADMRPLPRYAHYQSTTLNASFFVVFVATIFLAFYAVLGDILFDDATRSRINREDGTIEALSAVLFLVAAAASFRIAWRVGIGDRRFPIHLFLGVLFFVMCGEEISWGQRYLGLETPEAIAAVNVQGEINFHNMYGYFFDHIFIAAFFLWMVVVPLAAAYSRFFRRVFWLVGLPVASYGLAASALLVYVVFFGVLGGSIGTIPGLRLAEPRELLSAICFLVLMAEVLVFVPAPQRSGAGTYDHAASRATLRRGPR